MAVQRGQDHQGKAWHGEASAGEETQPLPEDTTPLQQREGRNRSETWLLPDVLQYSPVDELCQDCWGDWETWFSGKRHGVKLRVNRH